MHITWKPAKQWRREETLPLLYLILLLNEHRLLVMFVVAFITWSAAYGLYLRNYIRLWFNRGQRHSWSIDMATKKVVRQGKEEMY